ncbi:MAG: M14 family metallopeptidase [Nitrospinaceae bacterium]
MAAFQVLDRIPDALFGLEASGLHQVLAGPTLFHLPGKKEPPLFVSTLLHGNETTGFQAVKILLEKYRKDGESLPRSLFLFLGNVAAAKENVRRLPGEADYNRIWKEGEQPEHGMARELVRRLTRQPLFACVDVHNSSGRNPHYACINRLDPVWVNLARLFSPTVVYFIRPDTVLTNVFSDHCPAVTLESGQSGQAHGVQHVVNFLDRLLQLDAPPAHLEDELPYDLYHTLGRIEVPPGKHVAFSKAGNHADFCFLEQLDLFNFKELPKGELIGWRSRPDLHLAVVDEHGAEVEGEFLSYVGNEIRLARPLVPSMLSTEPEAVYQDCLGYLMERCTLPV